MEYQQIYERMLKEHYFLSREMIYDAKVGVHLSAYEYERFLSFKKEYLKEHKEIFHKLPLKTFNDAPLFYADCFELDYTARTYAINVLDDFVENGGFFASKHKQDLNTSRIYSEVEGSLNIESVPTKRKVVEALSKNEREPANRNEQIIKNMIEGIRFVSTTPELNEDNLFKLYTILSSGCLDEEDMLLDGHKYRHDGVEVGGYHGCPVGMIKECMDSFFSFINDNLVRSEYGSYLPHIAHYYLVYIHPYFDYNGRMARMLSYWVSLLQKETVVPPLVSEAINQTKNKYYLSLSETRDAHNDLTYFLNYLYGASLKCFFAYKNVEKIYLKLRNEASTVLSPMERLYLKKILMSAKGKFSHNDFTRWVGINLTKQGALKILNAFEDDGVLLSTISKSKNKLFEINKKFVFYTCVTMADVYQKADNI